MLLNPKGGCGKTTLATNLASFYASRGFATALVDYDAQGSSTRWLGVRGSERPPIYGIAAYRNPIGVTRSWYLRLPAGTERVVTDTPASIRAPELRELVRGTDTIVVPVLPSHIDIDAALDFMDVLQATKHVRSGNPRVAVVVNRVRMSGLVVRQLERFLGRVRAPVVARLRDARNYVRAGQGGAGIHELEEPRSQRDREQWAPLLSWIEGRPERDFAPPTEVSGPPERAFAVPT